jgi:hypothetical protein
MLVQSTLGSLAWLRRWVDNDRRDLVIISEKRQTGITCTADAVGLDLLSGWGPLGVEERHADIA